MAKRKIETTKEDRRTKVGSKFLVKLMPAKNKQDKVKNLNNYDREIVFSNIDINRHNPELEKDCCHRVVNAPQNGCTSIEVSKCKDCSFRFKDTIPMHSQDSIVDVFDNLSKATKEVREYSTSGKECEQVPIAYMEHENIKYGVTLEFALNEIEWVRKQGYIPIPLNEITLVELEDVCIKDVKKILEGTTGEYEYTRLTRIKEHEGVEKIETFCLFHRALETLEDVLEEAVAFERMVYAETGDVIADIKLLIKADYNYS